MRHPIRMLVWAALFGVLGRSAHADEAPPVDELVATALERAPGLVALRARAAASHEEIGPAGGMPDPMLEVMYQDVDFPTYTVGEEEMSMIAVELRQPLPFFGKRGARRQAARALATLRGREHAELQRQIELDVRRLVAEIYAVDGAQTSLAAASELLEMLEATVAARYSAGQTEFSDQVRTQLELSRVRERLDDLAAKRAALVAALNRYLDAPVDAPLGQVSSLPEQPLPAGWDTLALRVAPVLATRAAAVDAAAGRVHAARKEQPPDFYIGAGYSYRGDFDHVGTLRVGTELPFWRGGRTKPLVRAAEQELEMTRAEEREARALLRAEVTRLGTRFTVAESQLQRYREAIVPQTSTLLDAARASYVAGRGDFSTLVMGFQSWLESRLELASREAERYTAWAEIQALATPAFTEEGNRP